MRGHSVGNGGSFVITLTSAQALDMDVTELADLVTAGPFRYHATGPEIAALAWIGGRYAIVGCLTPDDEGWIEIDPWSVGCKLRAEGIDRVPCLAEDTALQRIVWAIGPS